MKLVVAVVGCLFLLGSCNTKKKSEKEALIMYESSEMTLLMNKMFDENMELKKGIIEGDDLTAFRKDYSKIHSAILTDPDDRTASFEQFSKAFIKHQKAIFHVETSEVITQYNTMVQSCIACHETTCTGPIPKIKKLLIK